MNKKVSYQEISEKLEECFGHTGMVAKKMGISRKALHDQINKKSKKGKLLKAKVEDMLCANDDAVRIVLLEKSVIDRDLPSIKEYFRIRGIGPSENDDNSAEKFNVKIKMPRKEELQDC